MGVGVTVTVTVTVFSGAGAGVAPVVTVTVLVTVVVTVAGGVMQPENTSGIIRQAKTIILLKSLLTPRPFKPSLPPFVIYVYIVVPYKTSFVQVYAQENT